MNAYRASQIPNVTAVNVYIKCSQCSAVIKGSPFWSIRKSAHLHATSCNHARWYLDDILAGMVERKAVA